MDGEKRGFGPASSSFPWSSDSPAELWHSTPVKKKNGGAAQESDQPSVLTNFNMDSTLKQWAKNIPRISADTPSIPVLQGAEFPVNDVSASTIQRQRKELQLLMAELKDRDMELNTMAASHHQQLYAWEKDRKMVLTLEHRCARLDDELQKRNEVIRVLTKRALVVETREKEVRKELSEAHQQLSELEQKQQNISKKCQDFEEKNLSLNSTVMALSTQVGSLQVREEELSSMLKLKDKDATEASGHVLDLTGRLRSMEVSLTESCSRESKLVRDLEEHKHRYREARHEITHLKEELQQQVTQSSTQREEIIRLKQELQLVRRDLALSGEGDSWKDELLELARSKQERTMSELRCLRQVCENQRNDLQLLQLNLESARETLREKTNQGTVSSGDEFTCGCAESRSPPSLRGMTGLQNPLNGDQGLFSAPLTDADDPLSSRSLQELLDESRQVVSTSDSSMLRRPSSSLKTSPLHCSTCQMPRAHSATPTHKVNEVPPKAYLRHGPSPPCQHLN
ncbi:coiled-coil domain-containing protein 62 isoform X2 [Sphaeramia orbicularis]|uniref:coiled-coil domain-containing protein 62 isoform X2 n=1 Tax=Sphaeramia orbicularis TaxID=375764 RepID=UPI00117D97F9|nr:coiled-coil domain-containing protein 62 isoform X2 [Sphaeramia orbicularis]